MSDTPKQNPAEVQRPRRDKTVPELPAEVIDALGGVPIPVPSSIARRVEAPAPSAKPDATRAANPLFDAPPADLEKATAALRLLRSNLGKVAAAMDGAIKQYLHATDAYPDLVTAAARENFDLNAAGVIIAGFETFLDQHKPKAAI